jgi:DNA-binding PadR family transcriptional regulator
MKEVERLTDGAVRLSTGTLYGIIKRLLAEGLIREARPGGDARRRRYELTRFGTDVARAEAGARADPDARASQGALQNLARHPMSRSERLFRALLRLFPAEFRGDFGDEMTQTFREHRQDVLARGGTMALLALWRDTIRGIVATAPREHLDVLRQDVRYGIRNLRRERRIHRRSRLRRLRSASAPTQPCSASSTASLFKALPYPSPEQLVVAFESLGGPLDRSGFSPPDFETLRHHATSFTDLAAYRNVSYELSGIGQSVRVKAAKVTPELFSVLNAVRRWGGR